MSLTRKYFKNTFLQKFMFCGLLLAGCITAVAQTDAGLQSLQQQFISAQQLPQEKTFVHTDKDFFLAGDILWFKVYVTDAFTNRPSALSTVAYVEVTDNDKKPVLQAKIKIDSGSGNGSFQLPTSVKSGNYTVRAYTSWMRNFSTDLYFASTITIVNTFRPLSIQAADTAAQYDMQFFPEGGNLVQNLPCKVAFRVIDRYGRGVNFDGKIIDQNGQQAAVFKPLKYGIGNFTFIPANGAKYTAVATINGRTISQALPEAYSDGYTLHVEGAGNKLQINIAGTGNAATVYLLVNTGNNIKTAQALQLQNGKTVYTIDKSALGDGITHFTVFNSQQKPVCERLYFKRPAQQLTIAIQPASQEYTQRSKVSVGIQTNGDGNIPVQADMSVSVYRIDSLQGLPRQNIMTWLLLNAGLKGTIENPAYYLDNTDAVASEALDNLVLTHGWSRYTWNDIMQNKAAPAYLPEYEGHIVTARVTDKKTGKPAADVTGYLTVPGKSFRLGIAKSDSSGMIRFNMKDFIGGDEIIVQTNQTADSTYRIDVINPFSDKGLTTAPSFTVSKDVQGLLLEHSIHTQAQNAYVGEKARQFYIAAADTIPFFGPARETYLLDDYTRFNTMEEVLREYVLEIEPRRQHGGFVLKVMDEPHSLFFDEDPLVMVDGVPFFNMDTVLALNPLKIRKLDIISQKYYYGPLVLSGIVSYTTYKGDLDGIALDPASLVQEYDGLQLQREFYSPKYDNPAINSSRIPDFRDVLYWSPNITTDAKTGKTQAAFYTSDVPGNYAIVVNGITADGKPGGNTYMITVK